MSSEQVELLLSQIYEKVNRMEEIKEAEVKKNEINNQSSKLAKQWLPVFVKPKSEWAAPSEEKKPDDGRSKVALATRIAAWAFGFVAILASIISAIIIGNALIFLITLFGTVFEIMLFSVLASVLDYLAELTAIARNGFKYSETKIKLNTSQQTEHLGRTD